MNANKLSAVTAALVASLTAISCFAGANKYVAAGWEFAGARVDTLLDRADAMDKTPLDGCVLYLEATGHDGKTITSRDIIHQPAWDYACLEPLVPKYRKLLAHKAFKSSFLNSYRAPRIRVAWTNDAAWAKIAHNMRVAARFAKACGFVGLQMDPEDYHRQNQYMWQDSDGSSYEETAALARRRGREVFECVFKEFPDVKLLSYWFLSMGNTYVGAVDGRYLRDIMYRNGTDLWPHFVEGIFDVLPPSATLVDGLETAYNWRASRMQYLTGAKVVRMDLVHLLSPENQKKYLTQMQNSFGFYLDGYSIITNGGWYMEPIDGSRVRHLRFNLKQATECADEFIWFWGERGSWSGIKGKPAWSELMPGLHDTMLAAKSPAELGRSLRLRMEAGELVNLNTNSACMATATNCIPKPYGTWQEHPKYNLRKGVFGCDLTCGHGDRSSLVAQGVQRGCFTFRVEGRRPGDVFGISFCSKGRHVSATVGWRKNSRWDWSITRILIPIANDVDADGWTQTDWSITIPDGADGFVLMLNVGQDEGEKCWYDDIMVIPERPAGT